MENNTNPQSVPFAAFESACTRLERANHRLLILAVVLVIALISTNAAWIAYESQFQTVETTETQLVNQEGERNNFIGGDKINYGSSDDNEDKND